MGDMVLPADMKACENVDVDFDGDDVDGDVTL
jgi:hypothetical protein